MWDPPRAPGGRRPIPAPAAMPSAAASPAPVWAEPRTGSAAAAFGAVGLAGWWVGVAIAIAVAAIAILVVNRRRQRSQAARGWRSRASELYSRSVALHDRLASSLGTRRTLSPEAVDRLGDAEWMVDDVAVAVAGLEVGAPSERARDATSDLATTLGSVRESIHLRVQMPDSEEAGEVVTSRLADLQGTLGRFRRLALNGDGGRGEGTAG